MRLRFWRKKDTYSIARAVAHFVSETSHWGRRKLRKKDLEVEIDGQKFYYIDIPLKEK